MCSNSDGCQALEDGLYVLWIAFQALAWLLRLPIWLRGAAEEAWNHAAHKAKHDVGCLKDFGPSEASRGCVA